MATPGKDHKPAHVWAWLIGAWAFTAAALPVWVPIVGGLLLVCTYALVCKVLPTYDCPRCAGRDTSANVVVGFLSSLFGGNRFGCNSRACHGGQRTRWGVRVFNPVHAQWLADNPGKRRIGV